MSRWGLMVAVMAGLMLPASVSALAEGEEKAVGSRVTEALAQAEVWLLPQPKEAVVGSGPGFDLGSCKGIRCVGPESAELSAVAQDLAARLRAVSDTSLEVSFGPAEAGYVVLARVPNGANGDLIPTPPSPEEVKEADQGYALRVTADGAAVSARTAVGLAYGVRTLAQAAAGKTRLPALEIRDWPALRYRGAQQDVSRGKVPTPETLNRLVDVLAEAKLNVMEPYIEHVYKFRAHPDSSPPEGYTPEEMRGLFDYAARRHVEVHPLFQVLGHSYHILNKPEYQHLRVGPCEQAPWIMTFDIRKPEAVAFVLNMVDELCETMPGTFFSVDITEIDIDGLYASGTSEDEVTDLVFNYVLQLNETVKRHGMRLLIAQGPLDSTGHLAGMGPKLDRLPKDIIVGSYYCAGGPYQPAWEKDFPRLEREGFDFFAQAWIDSHIRIIPWVQHAMEFSDLEVGRGLQHGAIGSTTCDWGDDGHYHLVGHQWYPFVYHGACAWTGAQVDRAYFDRAFTRVFYGIDDDSVARAILRAGGINGGTVKVKDDAGAVVERPSQFYWELTGDPFVHKDIVSLATPGETGREILAAADEAAEILQAALGKAARNRDNLEQLLFGARNYQAMGRKLVLVEHLRDDAYPSETLAEEVEALIAEYEALKAEFDRLWLLENRDNSGFRELLARFDHTLVPLRQKREELRNPETR